MGVCETCGGENTSDAEHCIHCGERIAPPGQCSSCGVVNLPGAEVCRICGADLTASGIRIITPTERPGYKPKFKTCPRCGRGFDNHLVECPHCENRLPDDHDITKPSSPLPFIAGTALFVSGILCILNGVIIGRYGGYVEEFAYCSFIEIMMGIVSITGWIFCMQRTHVVYALITAVVALLSVGPVFFGVPLSSLLGLFALVLLVLSIREFR